MKLLEFREESRGKHMFMEKTEKITTRFFGAHGIDSILGPQS